MKNIEQITHDIRKQASFPKVVEVRREVSDGPWENVTSSVGTEENGVALRAVIFWK